MATKPPTEREIREAIRSLFSRWETDHRYNRRGRFNCWRYTFAGFPKLCHYLGMRVRRNGTVVFMVGDPYAETPQTVEWKSLPQPSEVYAAVADLFPQTMTV
jgi:hypothetical protein